MKKDIKKTEIKSGAEIISDFFAGIGKIKGVDPKISTLFAGLHEADKFTDTNIKNGLSALREKK